MKTFSLIRFSLVVLTWNLPWHTRAKINNLINVVNNLLQYCTAPCQQCCAAPCQQYCAAPCQQLLSTTIVHSCSRSTIIVQSLLTTINKLFYQLYCQLMLKQHCNNYCSLSTSNNYRSNNTHQHCEFNKCCWTLITTLFRRCSANNVASTWSIFARVPHFTLPLTSCVKRHNILQYLVNSINTGTTTPGNILMFRWSQVDSNKCK